MSFREVHVDNGVVGMQYLGIATRMAVELSCHTPPGPQAESQPASQEASRLIWSCFNAECWTSLVLGRPPCIRASDIVGLNERALLCPCVDTALLARQIYFQASKKAMSTLCGRLTLSDCILLLLSADSEPLDATR